MSEFCIFTKKSESCISTIKSYILEKLTADNLNKYFGCNYNSSDFSINMLFDTNTLAGLKMEYAIIYNYDSVVTDNITNIQLDPDNIIEAIFFNEYREIRIYRNDNEFKGTVFIDLKDMPKEDSKDDLIEAELIKDKHSEFEKEEYTEPIKEIYLLYNRNSNKDDIDEESDENEGRGSGTSERYAKKLVVNKYIDYDEDNQAYISYVKPCKLIF